MNLYLFFYLKFQVFNLIFEKLIDMVNVVDKLNIISKYQLFLFNLLLI